MKVIVCVKQVPDVSEIKFDPATRTIVREGVPAVTNPFDRPAIALAVDLKTRFGVDTVVVTMGPPQAEAVLRDALSVGIDRAVHLCDRAFAGSDTLATARALAAFIRRERPDLVICGKYTVDGETAQVGPEIAELLDIPHVSGARKLTWYDGGIGVVAERESDEGHEIVAAELPCLITVAEHLMPPLGVRKAAVDAVRDTPIEVLTAASLGLSPSEVGAEGSPTWVAEIRALAPIARPPVEMIEGSIAEMADALADRIVRAMRLAPVPSRSRFSGQPRPAVERPIHVVVELTSAGELTPGTRQLLGEAARLCDAWGGEVVAVFVGGPKNSQELDCAEAGADSLIVVEHEALSHYSSEGWTAAVTRAIEVTKPWAVLFSSTERGRDFAPRVAARLGLGLTGDAIGLEIDGEGRLVQIKPAFGGHVVAPILSKTLPQMVTVRPGVLVEHEPDLPRPFLPWRTITLEEAPRIRACVMESIVTVDADSSRLAAAQVVVGVGFGVGEPVHHPMLQSFASSIGGALCATRRVTDKGWLPRQLQVGLSGKAIAPSIYVAIAIRGVINHTIGIQRAGTIIAINKDPKTPLFQMATYAAVADAVELVPALTAALTARLAG